MKSSEILELAQYGIGETINTPAGFFRKEQMKLQLYLSQRRASERIRCLSYNTDTGIAIPLIQNQIYYTLPPDCLEIQNIQYSDQGFLGRVRSSRPQVAPYDNSQPEVFWTQGQNTIGLFPAESSASNTVNLYLFGRRRTCICGMRLTYTGAGTAYTFTFDGTNFILTEGVTVVGTYPYGTYNLMSDTDAVHGLVHAINAASASNHCTAALDPSCPATRDSGTIECTTEQVYLLDTQSNAPANFTKRIYFDPELEDTLLNDIVVAELILQQRDKDLDSFAKQNKLAQINAIIEQARVEYERRELSSGNRMPKRSNSAIQRPPEGSVAGYYHTFEMGPF